LQRLLEALVGPDVLEIRILDAKQKTLLLRQSDPRGPIVPPALSLEEAGVELAKACLKQAAPAGRLTPRAYHMAAPVQEADGSSGRAVLVTVANPTLWDVVRRHIPPALAAAALVGLPGWWLARRLSKGLAVPLHQSMLAAEALAAGNLTGTVPPGGPTETGRLLTALARLSGGQRSLVGQVQTSGDLLTMTEAEASTALSRQERSLRTFSGSTAEIAAGLAKISATSTQLLGMTGDVTVVARQAAAVADEGRVGLENMGESMKKLDAALETFTRKLSSISQRTSGITSVITTIAKVADQTNLLSVNATIEAEKAGEAGRGFRIVAQEIRRLADQTALATKDIERMVREMQGSVSSGTMEMDKFHNEVSARIKEVAQVSAQLGLIITPVKTVTQTLETVHQGMQSQSQSVRQTCTIIEKLREGATDAASSTEGFAAALQGMREAIGQLSHEAARFQTIQTL
jgi:methyl-accepting chemotaxis protein WspA